MSAIETLFYIFSSVFLPGKSALLVDKLNKSHNLSRFRRKLREIIAAQIHVTQNITSAFCIFFTNLMSLQLNSRIMHACNRNAPLYFLRQPFFQVDPLCSAILSLDPDSRVSTVISIPKGRKRISRSVRRARARAYGAAARRDRRTASGSTAVR